MKLGRKFVQKNQLDPRSVEWGRRGTGALDKGRPLRDARWSVRFEHGSAAYLGDSWGELAGLVSWDEDFPFDGLPEATLTRLYEHGCWWSDSAVLGRPGVRRLMEMVSDGRLPYVLHQQVDGDDVALEDFLLGGMESAERSGGFLYLDIGYGCSVPLWYGGAALALQCRHVYDLVVSGELEVERFSPLLLGMVRRARADLLSFFSEAFRSSGGAGEGVCLHGVADCEGRACAYVVSRVPGALPFLRSLGLRVKEGGNLSSAVREMGLGEEGHEMVMMADLVMYSGILGDGAAVQGAVDAAPECGEPRCASDIQRRVMGEFYSEAGGEEEGFFLFCGDSTDAGASAVMDLVREAVSGRVSGLTAGL